MTGKSRLHSFTPPLALAIAALCQPVHAAWDALPVLSLTAESDDNVRLAPGEQPTSTRTALDARLRLTTFSEQGDAYIEPRFVADAYADDRDENLQSEDLFLRTGARRVLPRANFEFNSDFRQQSVLRSELDEALDDDFGDIEDNINTDAGTTGATDDERERFLLSLRGGYDLSDRTTFGLETSWLDVGYSNPSAVERSGFDSTSLGVTLTRSVDERNDMVARIYGTNFSAERFDNDSRSLGAEATFQRPLTETLSFSLNVGVARTEYEFLNAASEPVRGTSNGFTFGFDVEKRTERTTFTAAAGRTVSPSTTGFLAPRDDLSLSLRHRLSERMRFSGGIRAAEIDVVRGAPVTPRDYVRLTLELDWSLNERWSIRGGYDHVSEQFGAATQTEVESNAVFVGIRYQGQSRQ